MKTSDNKTTRIPKGLKFYIYIAILISKKSSYFYYYLFHFLLLIDRYMFLPTRCKQFWGLFRRVLSSF